MHKKQTKPAEKSRSSYFIKIPLFVVLVLLVCIGGAYLSRSWLRVTVLPKSVGVIYLHGVDSSIQTESDKLGQPFKSLGFTTIKKKKECTHLLAQGVHTQIDCSSMEQAYVKLPASVAGIAHVQSQAAALQAKLSSNGWRAGSNGVTVTSLVDGTAKGIDYSPDAFYEKIVGKNDCVFDVMIAYSNPQPPAIRGMMTCDRTFNVLGAPHAIYYNSNTGHLKD